jgi:hypothetical protein
MFFRKESKVNSKIVPWLGCILCVFAVLGAMPGCSTALHSGSKVNDSVGVAFDIYVATGKAIQKQVCCGDLVTVDKSRDIREAEGWYITHDCERAKTEGGLVCE